MNLDNENEKASSLKKSDHDAIYREPLGSVAAFKFDDAVAAVFPDMLDRSIPGYQAIISQSGLLAARFARSNTNLYDLGCSLGATALSMKSALLNAADQGRDDNGHNNDNSRFQGCTIHGIDNSSAMLERAKHLVEQHNRETNGHSIPVELHQGDMQQSEIINASVVAMNFTLQFIPPEHRDNMIARIATGLNDGGAFILSEKIAFADDNVNELNIDMYHQFKRANGYSDLEISQKRTALENVLIPDTLETHIDRLHSAGFKRCSVWFQCFNFVSLIASK